MAMMEAVPCNSDAEAEQERTPQVMANIGGSSCRRRLGLATIATLSLAAAFAGGKWMSGEIASGANTGHLIGLNTGMASCGVNAAQAAVVLARTGVLIAASIEHCDKANFNETVNEEGEHYFGYEKGFLTSARKKSCALDLLSILASVTGLGTLGASLAITCHDSANYDSICAAGGIAIGSGFINLGAMALTMNMACAEPPMVRKDLDNTSMKDAVYAPYLKAQVGSDAVADVPNGHKAGSDEHKAGYHRQTAMCVINTAEVATTIAQVGLAIKASMKDCPYMDDAAVEAVLSGMGVDYSDPNMQPMIEAAAAKLRAAGTGVCVADVAAIIGSFAEIAAFLSLMTNQCTHADPSNAGATCAFAIQDFITTVNNVVAGAATVNLACPEAMKASSSGGSLRSSGVGATNAVQLQPLLSLNLSGPAIPPATVTDS